MLHLYLITYIYVNQEITNLQIIASSFSLFGKKSDLTKWIPTVHQNLRVPKNNDPRNVQKQVKQHLFIFFRIHKMNNKICC